MTDREQRQHWLRRFREYFRAVAVVREFEAEQSRLACDANRRLD